MIGNDTYGLNLDMRQFHSLKTETQSSDGLIIYVLVSSVYPKLNENTKILLTVYILATLMYVDTFSNGFPFETIEDLNNFCNLLSVYFSLNLYIV